MNLTANTCGICAAPQAMAEFSICKETRKQGQSADDFFRRHEQWLDGPVMGRFCLCETCCAWAANLMHIAADGLHQSNELLGLPVAAPLMGMGDGHCDYCKSDLGAEAYGVDLLVNPLAPGRGRGPARQQRLCRQCATWWLAILDDSATLRGKGARKSEGPIGNWTTTARSDAAGLYLSRRDDYVLRVTIEDDGRQYVPVTHRQVHSLPPGTALFVTAGKKSRAEATVQALPPEMRRTVVVVARLDCLADTAAALLAGAGDFLVSPLSPQQVAGAIERLARAEVHEREPATGLPVLSERAEPRLNEPGHVLRVLLPRGESVLASALLLRRFLRGYDSIGVDPDGALIAHLACPDAALPGILDRLTRLLANGATLEIVTPAMARTAAFRRERARREAEEAKARAAVEARAATEQAAAAAAEAAVESMEQAPDDASTTAAEEPVAQAA